MSVKIEVLDRSGRPRVGDSVLVRWSSGISQGHTDGNGIFDTRTSGTILSVQVHGKTVYSSAGRRATNDTISVVYN